MQMMSKATTFEKTKVVSKGRGLSLKALRQPCGACCASCRRAYESAPCRPSAPDSARPKDSLLRTAHPTVENLSRDGYGSCSGQAPDHPDCTNNVIRQKAPESPFQTKADDSNIIGRESMGRVSGPEPARRSAQWHSNRETKIIILVFDDFQICFRPSLAP